MSCINSTDIYSIDGMVDKPSVSAFQNFLQIENRLNIKKVRQKCVVDMADEHTPGDELTLYVLAHMYRHHAYVFTQMFWWTTLLYTVPVTEKELLNQCDVVLVYIKEGVFGELEMIRSPAPKRDTGPKRQETTASTPGSDMHQPPDSNTGQSNVNYSVAGITRSTPDEKLHGNNKLVITENPAEVPGNSTHQLNNHLSPAV